MSRRVEFCAPFEGDADALVRGDASLEVSAAFGQHRGECPTCSARWSACRAAVAELGRIPQTAQPDAVWQRIEATLAEEDQRALEPWWAVLRSQPLEARPETAWRRLEVTLSARRRALWMDVAALVLVGCSVWALLVGANDVALEAAGGWLRGNPARWLDGFAASEWRPFFLPLAFASVGSAMALVCAPLLRCSLQSQRVSGGRFGPRPLLQGEWA